MTIVSTVGTAGSGMQYNPVAVLFARKDSIYKTLPGCDVFDLERDARNYRGPFPVVAHPPCRSWCRLRAFAKPRHDERDLAIFAVDQVRKYGGVLEHPLGSELWRFCRLPRPGHGSDSYGGFSIGINQNWFGHRAEKKTLLYIKGVFPSFLPPVPFCLDYAETTVERLSHSARELTPPLFAQWLVDLAKRCGGVR